MIQNPLRTLYDLNSPIDLMDMSNMMTVHYYLYMCFLCMNYKMLILLPHTFQLGMHSIVHPFPFDLNVAKYIIFIQNKKDLLKSKVFFILLLLFLPSVFLNYKIISNHFQLLLQELPILLRSYLLNQHMP